MLVIKNFLQVIGAILCLSSCSIQAENFPFYDHLKKVVNEYEVSIEEFSEIIAGEKGDVRLQYLGGELSYKKHINERWMPYNGLNSGHYTKTMREVKVRFAGLVDKKIYLGGMSKQIDGKMVIVEIARYLETIPRPDCKSIFMMGDNGGCIIQIQGDWMAHYSWVAY